MKSALLARTLLILAVALAILVPIKLIEGKIAERRARADSVVERFAAETGGAQVVVGPLLALTCEETYVIYPIRLYRATLDLAGEFEWPGPPALDSAKTRVWKDAYVVIGVSDARGIKSLSSSISALQSGGARRKARDGRRRSRAACCSTIRSTSMRFRIARPSTRSSSCSSRSLYVILKSEDHALLMGSLGDVSRRMKAA